MSNNSVKQSSKCTACGTDSSSTYRKGPAGSKTLCGACYQKWKGNKLELDEEGKVAKGSSLDTQRPQRSSRRLKNKEEKLNKEENDKSTIDAKDDKEIIVTKYSKIGKQAKGSDSLKEDTNSEDQLNDSPKTRSKSTKSKLKTNKIETTPPSKGRTSENDSEKKVKRRKRTPIEKVAHTTTSGSVLKDGGLKPSDNAEKSGTEVEVTKKIEEASKKTTQKITIKSSEGIFPKKASEKLDTKHEKKNAKETVIHSTSKEQPILESSISTPTKLMSTSNDVPGTDQQSDSIQNTKTRTSPRTSSRTSSRSKLPHGISSAITSTPTTVQLSTKIPDKAPLINVSPQSAIPKVSSPMKIKSNDRVPSSKVEDLGTTKATAVSVPSNQVKQSPLKITQTTTIKSSKDLQPTFTTLTTEKYKITANGTEKVTMIQNSKQESTVVIKKSRTSNDGQKQASRKDVTRLSIQFPKDDKTIETVIPTSTLSTVTSHTENQKSTNEATKKQKKKRSEVNKTPNVTHHKIDSMIDDDHDDKASRRKRKSSEIDSMVAPPVKKMRRSDLTSVILSAPIPQQDYDKMIDTISAPNISDIFSEETNLPHLQGSSLVKPLKTHLLPQPKRTDIFTFGNLRLHAHNVRENPWVKSQLRRYNADYEKQPLQLDTLILIFAFCDVKTLGRASQVNFMWNMGSIDNIVWKYHYHSRWPIAQLHMRNYISLPSKQRIGDLDDGFDWKLLYFIRGNLYQLGMNPIQIAEYMCKFYSIEANPQILDSIEDKVHMHRNYHHHVLSIQERRQTFEERDHVLDAIRSISQHSEEILNEIYEMEE